MKPRTKFQKRVFGFSEKLLDLTEKQEYWAKKECLEHYGYANKQRVGCMDCGTEFSLDLISRKRATCPHCQTKLKIEHTRKTTLKQYELFAMAELYGEFQVIRNFKIESSHKVGQRPRYWISEILQYWVDPNGKYEMVGRLHNTQGYCDSWGGDWAIRKETGYWALKYKIHPYKYHPDSIFESNYLKLGINHKVVGLMFLDAIELIPNNPQAETLLKAKQYSLLNKCLDNSGIINRHWPSIKICMRKRYKVKDAGMWIDYLDLLWYFRKDLRNSHYVCPQNLKKSHDRLVAKKRAIQEREENERKRAKAKAHQKDYQKEKGKYFGLEFDKGKITIRVLSSVQEFIEEGDFHKHCLYANNYHKKTDSLCLSALVNGKRMETIEVSLSKLKVIQARGKRNQASKYHEEIVSLMQENMRFIKAIRDAKPKKKAIKRESTLTQLLAS